MHIACSRTPAPSPRLQLSRSKQSWIVRHMPRRCSGQVEAVIRMSCFGPQRQAADIRRSNCCARMCQCRKTIEVDMAGKRTEVTKTGGAADRAVLEDLLSRAALQCAVSDGR